MSGIPVETVLASVAVRDATAADFGAITAIYAEHVRHGLASFEETPPPVEEMLERWRAITARGMPYLVAHTGDTIVGYSYVSPYRARSAYRFSLENSVYVAAEGLRRGVGTRLLAELIRRCEQGPWRLMIAVIGDSANASSIALHRKLGFSMVGTLQGVGFKHGRWVDTVLMQRALGAGDATLPEQP